MGVLYPAILASEVESVTCLISVNIRVNQWFNCGK